MKSCSGTSMGSRFRRHSWIYVPIGNLGQLEAFAAKGSGDQAAALLSELREMEPLIVV